MTVYGGGGGSSYPSVTKTYKKPVDKAAIQKAAEARTKHVGTRSTQGVYGQSGEGIAPTKPRGPKPARTFNVGGKSTSSVHGESNPRGSSGGRATTSSSGTGTVAVSNKNYKGKYPGPDKFKGDTAKIAAWQKRRQNLKHTLRGQSGEVTGGATQNSGGGHTTIPGSKYTVKSGDSLSSIAKSHGTTVSALEKKNPSLKKNPNAIYRGTKIKF